LTLNDVGALTIVPEIHCAFRGRLVSLLVLTHCGVSPRPFLPLESPCISSAGISSLPISRVNQSK